MKTLGIILGLVLLMGLVNSELVCDENPSIMAYCEAIGQVECPDDVNQCKVVTQGCIIECGQSNAPDPSSPVVESFVNPGKVLYVNSPRYFRSFHSNYTT